MTFSYFFFFFFFNDTATTEIYTLSLHDALPIYVERADRAHRLHDRAIETRRVQDEPHAIQAGDGAVLPRVLIGCCIPLEHAPIHGVGDDPALRSRNAQVRHDRLEAPRLQQAREERLSPRAHELRPDGFHQDAGRL